MRTWKAEWGPWQAWSQQSRDKDSPFRMVLYMLGMWAAGSWLGSVVTFFQHVRRAPTRCPSACLPTTLLSLCKGKKEAMLRTFVTPPQGCDNPPPPPHTPHLSLPPFPLPAPLPRTSVTSQIWKWVSQRCQGTFPFPLPITTHSSWDESSLLLSFQPAQGPLGLGVCLVYIPEKLDSENLPAALVFLSLSSSSTLAGDWTEKNSLSCRSACSH